MERQEVTTSQWYSALAQVILGFIGVIIEKLSISYFWMFYAGILESVSIESVSALSHPGILHDHALLNNSLLVIIFCGIHSVLARQRVKKLLLFFMSAAVYRYLFLVQSSLLLFFICYGWQPLSTPCLWNIQYPPLRLAFCGMMVLGLMMNIIAFFSLPVLDFIGIREPLHTVLGSAEAKGGRRGELITTGMYGLVRHPMYTGILTFFWFNPTMTVSRFLVVGVLTLYVVIAVPLFEEPSLQNLFGDKYREYIERTPMLLPIGFLNRQYYTKLKKSS